MQPQNDMAQAPFFLPMPLTLMTNCPLQLPREGSKCVGLVPHFVTRLTQMTAMWLWLRLMVADYLNNPLYLSSFTPEKSQTISMRLK